MAVRKSEEVKERILSWLKEEGSKVELKNEPGRLFTIEFTSTNGRSYHVFQRLEKSDKVMISGKVVLSPRHRKGLQNLPHRIRSIWLADLRLALIHQNLNFRFLPSLSAVDEIIVRKPIWYDGLTKNEFLQSVRQVNSGISLVVLKLRRRLGRP